MYSIAQLPSEYLSAQLHASVLLLCERCTPFLSSGPNISLVMLMQGTGQLVLTGLPYC